MGMISDADQKIADFSASFQTLKESFDRATEIQVLLYTSRISQDMRRLGEYNITLNIWSLTIIARSNYGCTEIADPARRFYTTAMPSRHSDTHNEVYFGVGNPPR